MNIFNPIPTGDKQAIISVLKYLGFIVLVLVAMRLWYFYYL